MQVRRSHARLVLAGYLGLALAIPALTPSLPEANALPPIAPMVLADNSAGDDAAMRPLHRQASAAMQALQTTGARSEIR